MFTTLFGRPQNASLEDPTLSLNDPETWKAVMGGSIASSGVTVNRTSAMSHPPLFSAVKLLAGDVSKIPFIVYQRDSDDIRQRAKDHRAYHLLRRKVNSYLTALNWKKTMMYHALIYGNGYSVINRDGAARPLELLPIDPCSTFPVLYQGKLWYVTEADGKLRKFESDDVFHVKGISFDGLEGEGLLPHMRDTIGVGLAMKKFLGYWYDRGSRAAGVIELPAGVEATDKAIEETRRQFENIHSGLDNAFRVAILQQGAKWVQTSLTYEQSELLATREFDVKDVARMFRIPPHKLGDSSKTSYSSIEAENLSYLSESLDEWFCIFEDEGNCKLLTEREQREDTHYTEFLRSAMLRSDTKTRFEVYGIGIDKRIWNPNEVRKMENMPPYEGGDEFINPAITPTSTGESNSNSTETSESSSADGGEGSAENQIIFPEGRQSVDPVVADLAEFISKDSTGKSRNQLAKEFIASRSINREPATALRYLRSYQQRGMIHLTSKR